MGKKLPILVTAPGAKLAHAYISKHLIKWNKAYLIKDTQSVNWDKSLIHGASNTLPPGLENSRPAGSILTTPLHNKHKSSQNKTVNNTDNYLTPSPVCKNCTPDSILDIDTFNYDCKCKVCTPYADLSKNARLLLHHHNRLDHMGFVELKELARQQFLPKEITLAERVICASRQMGKGHKTARGKSQITKSVTSKVPGEP